MTQLMLTKLGKTQNQMRPCAKYGCTNMTRTLYCADCLGKKRAQELEQPAECRHMLTYTGKEYVEKMIPGFFDTHRRPVWFEEIHVCANPECHHTRYTTTVPPSLYEGRGNTPSKRGRPKREPNHPWTFAAVAYDGMGDDDTDDIADIEEVG